MELRRWLLPFGDTSSEQTSPSPSHYPQAGNTRLCLNRNMTTGECGIQLCCVWLSSHSHVAQPLWTSVSTPRSVGLGQADMPVLPQSDSYIQGEKYASPQDPAGP